MAKFNTDMSFSGSLSNLSIYRMRGIDKPIVRTKGGATRDKIRRLPSFEPTRQLNTEWGGCAKAGKNIRLSLSSLRHLADYNISGTLNAIAKIIQLLDPAAAKGKRSIYISRYRHALQGFSLNNKTTFDGVVRQPVSCTLNRDTLTATLQLPQLIPGINLHTPGQYPLFRIIAELGVVPDMVYTPVGYQPVNIHTQLYSVSAATAWSPASIGFAAQTLVLVFNNPIGLDESSSLMLSIGIEFGVSLTDSVVMPVKNAGAAKILLLA